MEYNGICLFGFGRWQADGIIGKSGAWPKILGWKLGAWPKIFGWKLGAWPKILGWKYDKPTENIGFEIRKNIGYLWNYKLVGVAGPAIRSSDGGAPSDTTNYDTKRYLNGKYRVVL
jgi:hypothetical protein